MEKRHAAKEQRQESDGYSVGSRLGGSVSLPERTLWGCLCIQIAGTDLSPSTPYSPCQYHSTIAPYSFIHLPPTLYNAFLPVHQFSPVIIIPPLLHTHSFTYHPRCIMLFSQYISFPLLVSFHHYPILTFTSTLFSSEGQ